MKLISTISEITHDDLVNLFSTATYGSNYFDVAKKKKDYYGTELEDANDCREDTWAKILLSGKPVYVLDYYSEEESYGKLPHEWDDKRGAMKYTVTLEDIKKGLQKAIDIRKVFRKLLIMEVGMRNAPSTSSTTIRATLI